MVKKNRTIFRKIAENWTTAWVKNKKKTSQNSLETSWEIEVWESDNHQENSKENRMKKWAGI